MTEQQDDGMTIQWGRRRQSFRTPVLSKDLSRMPADRLPEAAYELHGLIADYCGILAETLYLRPKRQEDLFARLQAARRAIDKPKEPADQVVTLNDAIFEVHRVHAIIAKEQEFINQSVRLRWISPALVLFYIIIVIGIMALGWKSDEEFMMPMIGIPLAVLLWSLIGSVAAILYRFYTYHIRELSEVSLQVTWLIARPLTGIIMGMVSYLTIVAGLFVFGSATQSNTGTTATRPELLWLVAFLAGFSDKFFEGFMRNLLSRISGPAPESGPSAAGTKRDT
jgi:hypothetical protein